MALSTLYIWSCAKSTPWDSCYWVHKKQSHYKLFYFNDEPNMFASLHVIGRRFHCDDEHADTSSLPAVRTLAPSHGWHDRASWTLPLFSVIQFSSPDSYHLLALKLMSSSTKCVQQITKDKSPTCQCFKSPVKAKPKRIKLNEMHSWCQT